jgi:hypothetical protein
MTDFYKDNKDPMTSCQNVRRLLSAFMMQVTPRISQSNFHIILRRNRKTLFLNNYCDEHTARDPGQYSQQHMKADKTLVTNKW